MAEDLEKIGRIIQEGNKRDIDDALFMVETEKEAKMLLEAGADPNAHPSYFLIYGTTHLDEGDTPLKLSPNAAITKLLLEYGADGNAVDKSGKTALFYARSAEQIKLLVKAGIDVNATDSQGNTALFHVKTVEQAKALLEMGIDVNKENSGDRTALGLIISPHGYYVTPVREDSVNKELIEVLKNHGAKKSQGDLKHELYKELSDKARTDRIKELLKEGAIPYDGDSGSFWDDYLRWAKDAEQTKLLLEAGAKYIRYHKPYEMGHTALMRANDAEQTKLLLEAGGIKDINYVSHHGDTALSCAQTAEQTRLLLEAGADPNLTRKIDDVVDVRGLTPLMRAKTAEQTKMLLDAGAIVDLREASFTGGRTALFFARTAEQTKLLLDAGANVNALDSLDETALFEAKTSEQAKLLIDAGIKVMQKNREGKTAFDCVDNPEVKNVIKIAMLKIDLDANKSMTADIRSGVANTQKSGYKHITETERRTQRTVKHSGRED